MGLLSHRVERSEIAAGDHIYTWRALFAYSHHGVYVGRNKVVHFTRGLSQESSWDFLSSFSSSSVVSSTCCNFPDCGFRQPESGVVLSCLDCFLTGGSLYRFEYKVAPSAFLAKLRGGTCTTAESDPQEAVIHRAMYLLRNGFGNYDVLMNNCEDFAIYCKTGLLVLDRKAPGRSGQAASVISAPLAGLVSSSLKFFMSNPVAVITATAGMYCMSRYATDIGVRTDVIKVPVEDIVSFHGCGGSDDRLTEENDCSKGQERKKLIGNDNPPFKRQRCY